MTLAGLQRRLAKLERARRKDSPGPRRTEAERREFFIALGLALGPFPDAKAAVSAFLESQIDVELERLPFLAELGCVLNPWPEAKLAAGQVIEEWLRKLSQENDP